MRAILRLRWPLLVVLGLICLVPGVALASSAPRAHPQHQEFTAGSAAGAAHANAIRQTQFQTTANPLTLDPPVPVPPTTPDKVTIISNTPFPDANGNLTVTRTVTLPSGSWSEAVLHVDGTQSGRQYDRLMQVYDGSVPLFIGVTPEPTAAGITWNLTKDVSDYQPILRGQQTFTVNVDNYPNSLDNGIPKISVSLWFYSGHAPSAIPDSIVPVGTPGSTTLDTINANGTLTATVTLPSDLRSVRLHLFAVAQIGEEFWWGMEPAFREIEISVDGKPAGVIWPFPYIYTGGVNPLIWRPITAIHTMDFPAYEVDLTPFAGLLGGQHTLSITVTNNTGYWLVGGDLFLGENGGKPTGGKLLADTLTFPTTASTDTTTVFGDSANTVTGQTANLSYEIKGQITSGHDRWTDDLNSSLQFSNDQSNLNSGYLQYVHGEQVATMTETLTSAHGPAVTQKETDTYTVDAPSDFIQPSGSSAFFLPAQVAQSLDVRTATQVGDAPAQNTHLYENVQGYGALAENGAASPITDGSTTGYVSYENAAGQEYQRLVVARGGVILHDDVRNGLTWQR